ncbi:MAG: hypothetical protein HC804_02385 [Anaerolineae bacterium]|nr:hypothetical protein [Anaerolineae bacterium]
MSYWVTVSDSRRAVHWQRLFGTNRLPVLAAATRWDMVDGREVPCYDLALKRLSQPQRYRLACYAARRLRRPYVDVLAEINTATSWPIRAAGCVVEYEEEQATVRPSPFLLPTWGMFARKHLHSLPVAQ